MWMAIGRERTNRVRDEVVNEPRNTDGKQAGPVALEDKPIGDSDVFHRIFLESIGLGHPESPNEHCCCRDHTKTREKGKSCQKSRSCIT